MTVRICHWPALDASQQAELLQRPAVRADQQIRTQVAEIVAAVRERGDDAVRALGEQLDGVRLQALKVSAEEIDAATRELDAAAVQAIDLAIANVSRFHEQQRPARLSIETMPGVHCERVSHALDAVGLYVPAGTAPLPSAAIMLAVPARIAGCPLRIMCTPPRADGRADPGVVVAAARAGITDIFKIGGAQAVAAMAYGTESVPKVCKIFGPGNAWVTSAKSQVSADPAGAAIDMPAGPSEVLVIADANASAEFVAADLLSQAEHGADSQVLLLTNCESLAAQVQREVSDQLAQLSRRTIAAEALQHSHIVLVEDMAEAIDISNRYAPEHLILQLENAAAYLPQIRNAGSVFVGPWSPESAGDYCSGTNHVLPTYGYAQTYSGLGVDQFMRHMTVQELSREGLNNLGAAIITLATLEGLDAHAQAVQRRLAAEL